MHFSIYLPNDIFFTDSYLNEFLLPQHTLTDSEGRERRIKMLSRFSAECESSTHGSLRALWVGGDHRVGVGDLFAL